ncbi:MAG: type II toxin-antitoxin system HicA family toxin [Thermomicrobiales bacterium]
MNTKQRRTLERLFARPTPAEISWDDIESLLRALDVEFRQAAGSKIRIEVNGIHTVLHVPHPRPVARRGRIEAVRDFLMKAGIRP